MNTLFLCHHVCRRTANNSGLLCVDGRVESEDGTCLVARPSIVRLAYRHCSTEAIWLPYLRRPVQKPHLTLYQHLAILASASYLCLSMPQTEV